jgi:hypothetical protein
MNEQAAKSEEKNATAGGPVVKTGDAILKESELPEGVITSERLTAIQHAGMHILLFVGALGAVVIVGLGLEYFLQTPRVPTLDPAKDPNYVTNLLSNYKEISGAVLSHTKELFDMVVVKVLYPLATLVLGYVFGKRTAETKQD